MENEREQDKVANADEQHQPQVREQLVPDSPGLHPLAQRRGNQQLISYAAEEGDGTEQEGCQQFVPAVQAEAEGLQEVQDQENDDTV